MLEKQLRLDWVVTEASTAEEVVDLYADDLPGGGADGGRDSFHSGGHREQFDLLVLDENFGEGLMLDAGGARAPRRGRRRADHRVLWRVLEYGVDMSGRGGDLAHRRLREIGATAWPKPFPGLDGSLSGRRQILRFSSAASAPV